MKYDAYLFDFDYTLANAETGIIIAYRSVLEKHGLPGVSDDAIRRTIGQSLPDGFTALCGETDKDKLEEYRTEYVAVSDVYMTANTVFYPGAVALVRRIKSSGKRTGIVSTKYAYRIRAALEKDSIAELFDVIVGGDMVAQFKPDPAGVLQAVDKLNVDKNRVLYVGDTVMDAETAQRAGVDFIGVTTGVTTAEELGRFPHVAIVSDLSEIEGAR